NVPSIMLAERLLDLTHGAMQAVFLTSGGSEANESAFKTARFYWKASGKPDKVKVIARDQAYHGLTLQTMSATGMVRGYWKMFEPRVPGFLHVQTCYPYRYQGAKPGETVGQAAARELEETILREGPDTVAAFVAEPIHGAGGVFYPTDDYWPLVREVCTRHDVLLIADEIITGFCRTGRLGAVEFVEDRATKKNFGGELRFAARLKAEMMKRGVITRTRPAVGPHPAPGDILFFAPLLVINEAEVDRLVAVAHDGVKA